MTEENKSAASVPGRETFTKGHQGEAPARPGLAQDGHPGAAVARPIKIDGGYQGPTSQGAPAKPPSGGSSGSKK